MPDKQKDYISLLKRSLNAIRVLEEKLGSKEKGIREPIAIVGMACRFPGGSTSPEKFWELLSSGKDAVRTVPLDRWDQEAFYDSNPEAQGKMYVNKAGFLDEDVGAFDAKFFGISPREAVEMDPQQRLLLEVGWEALESAGTADSSLKGSKTGVFVGMTGSDYGLIPRDPGKVGPYTATGVAANIASGRIAHILGLHGPAISIDTACSSSLVAVHLACESIRQGDCDMAIAGGVNLMLAPDIFIMLSKTKALSGDCKCKSFDESGDGYVRAEGCGMIVLKSLSAAQKDGDNILALIRGSAINQDGPTSGLTVPNGLAQARLIQSALESAGVSPGEISFLEAHGTGTALGDPIEMQALSDVFGQKGSRKNPLIVGAVKSNIGHLEAAAGIAGLFKAVLSLQYRQIPPNLHFRNLNPRINLNKIPAVIPTELIPWESQGKARLCGISSFGFSGTNAHLIISEPPVKSTIDFDKNSERALQLLAVSAKDKKALKDIIVNLKAYIKGNPECNLQDICYTANAYRSHFTHRAVFIADSLEAMLSKLEAFSSGNMEEDEETYRQTGDNEASKLAFVFGDSLESVLEPAGVLVRTQPVFRRAIEVCNNLFYKYTGIMLGDYISGQMPDKDVGVVGEACFFSIQYALVQLWDSWGIKPTAVLSFGIGEYAAAYTAGIMSLDTALRLIAEKNRLYDGKLVEKESLHSPRLRFVLAATGKTIDKNDALGYEYWMREDQGGQALKKAVGYLYKQGYGCFAEISTSPCLAGSIRSFSGQNPVRVLPGTRKCDIWGILTDSLAELYLLGAEINWKGFYDGCQCSKYILPTYPFQKKHFWLEPYDRSGGENKASHVVHPLKGRLLQSPLSTKQFEYSFTVDDLPELRDTQNVLHIGYYQEMLSEAVKTLYKEECHNIVDMEFIQALYFEESTAKRISLVIEPQDEHGLVGFKFFSTDDSCSEWFINAQGKLKPGCSKDALSISPEPLASIRERCTRECSGEELYGKLEKQGFVLGDSVKLVCKVWYRDGEALACFDNIGNSTAYSLGIHPGILDACAQLFLLTGEKHIEKDKLFMVRKLEEYIFDSGSEHGSLWCHMTTGDSLTEEGLICGDYSLFDENGIMIACARGKQVKTFSQGRGIELRESMEGRKTAEVNDEKGQLRQLLNADAANSRAILGQYLHQVVAQLFGMPPEEIDINEPLMNIGMDSMVGLELKRKIDYALDIKMPMEIIIKGSSIKEMEADIRKLLPAKIQEENKIHTHDWYTRSCDMSSQAWLVHRKVNPKAKVRLFCIPYGVVGASLYREWQKNLPDFIEVCPVQFPGKENRINEKPIGTIDEAIDCLEKVLAPELTDRPYAFYGHSLGALLAYRITCRLWQTREIKPSHLFVGAYTSPCIYPNPTYEKVLAGFRHIGFDSIPGMEELMSLTPKKRKKFEEFFTGVFELNMNDEVRLAMQPVVFSEFGILDSYTYSQGEPKLGVPITAFHGINDSIVSQQEMEAWKELAKNSFKLHVFSGDHFFLHENQNRSELLEIITSQLKSQ